MAGGLLNLIALGHANIFLNGNPCKTFFSTVYSKYTNFGLQKFRIDYSGSRDLFCEFLSAIGFAPVTDMDDECVSISIF